MKDFLDFYYAHVETIQSNGYALLNLLALVVVLWKGVPAACEFIDRIYFAWQNRDSVRRRVERANYF